jgi:hypothetical protein
MWWVIWFATKQLVLAGVADVFRAEHGYAGDDAGHSGGSEPGRASHVELLAAWCARNWDWTRHTFTVMP